jgi:streptomycin 3"-adenylyltransferase
VSLGGWVDPALDRYLAALAGGLARVVGPALIGVYLHGSAALGGWSAERSDVDLLGVVARPLDRRAKRVLAARLHHPSLTCPSPAGLELSLVTATVAADPPRRPPFELHVSTGPAPRTHLGGAAAADPDLLLYFAVCRRAGLAVTGPEPVQVFAEPPRAWLLERATAELRWAMRHGSFAYRVLTACRAWRYLEDDVLGAKVDGGRWARLRLADPVGAVGAPPVLMRRDEDPGPAGAAALVDAAVAAQLGHAPMPDAPADLLAADRFVRQVLDRFAPVTGR